MRAMMDSPFAGLEGEEGEKEHADFLDRELDELEWEDWADQRESTSGEIDGENPDEVDYVEIPRESDVYLPPRESLEALRDFEPALDPEAAEYDLLYEVPVRSLDDVRECVEPELDEDGQGNYETELDDESPGDVDIELAGEDSLGLEADETPFFEVQEDDYLGEETYENLESDEDLETDEDLEIDAGLDLEAGGGRTIKFLTDVSLRVVDGPTAKGQEFWDPHHTGNPLLDTGGANANLKIAPNFTVRELASSGGVLAPIARIDPKLVECLQAIRSAVGRAVHVTSGFRSWKRNVEVYRRRGQKPTLSRHCSGQAADIKVRGMSGEELAKAAMTAYGCRIAVGVGGNYAHVDVRPKWQRWTYFRDKAEDARVKKRLDAHQKACLARRREGGGSAVPAPSSPSGTETSTTHVTVRKGAGWGGEKGVAVRTTMRFRRVTTHQDAVIAAMGAAEGGFDTVNMYDRGIVSWGLMQWTLHAGSLQNMLAFAKESLGKGGQSSVWKVAFATLDVQKVGRNNEIVVNGRPIIGNSALRRTFKGTDAVGAYDLAVASRWARLFALAGRNPAIQRTQVEYAKRSLALVLRQKLGSKKGISSKFGVISDYIGNDYRAQAVVFGNWTNNRVQAYKHLARAIQRVADKYGGNVAPSGWPAGWEVELGRAIETVFRASRFGMWGDAKAKSHGRTARTKKILDEYDKVVAQLGS